ncbi:TIGR03084 family metal-binding protein [Mycobacterium goodii]|uniref:Wyosine base formation domain-containing protein n=1 Tax=Mycolicibacterium goodii TaxID=134601 RepID=A0A0K0X3B1_MYCGD|nr:wyosine base formation domain-containing protein [Mycolicibacterium goodii]
MALDYGRLLGELRFESELLTGHLQELPFEQWGRATPAVGWGIQDQVSHLAFFDDAARLALTDPDEFRAMADELMAGGMDFPDRIAEQHRILAPDELTRWYVTARRDLLAALADDDPKRRIPWFGPDMSVASSATARLMETWAHGRDIYETLGVQPPVSPGLRSIAHLGVSTFAFSHRLNGLDVPSEAVAVQLKSPDGETWAWGPDDAANRIVGSAEDFVLVVTQRRHWTDTGLTVEGPVATGWMEVAQAFAGAATKTEPKVRP